MSSYCPQNSALPAIRSASATPSGWCLLSAMRYSSGRRSGLYTSWKTFRFHPVTVDTQDRCTYPGTGEAGLLDSRVLILHDGTHQYRLPCSAFRSDAVRTDGAVLVMHREALTVWSYSIGSPTRRGCIHLQTRCRYSIRLDEWQKFPGKKCKHTDSDARVALNGGADNNIEFLSQSPDPHYHDWVLQDPEGRFPQVWGILLLRAGVSVRGHLPPLSHAQAYRLYFREARRASSRCDPSVEQLILNFNFMPGDTTCAGQRAYSKMPEDR
jgi:hypothetical protein